MLPGLGFLRYVCKIVYPSGDKHKINIGLTFKPFDLNSPKIEIFLTKVS
jgi:hypothetical protein